MSREEAIKVLRAANAYGNLGDCIYKALKILESEPEPGEFTKNLRKEYHIAPDAIIDKIKSGHGNCCTCQKCGYGHDDCRCCENRIIGICNEIDRLEAVLSFIKQELGAANAELKDLKEMKLWKPEDLSSKP